MKCRVGIGRVLIFFVLTCLFNLTPSLAVQPHRSIQYIPSANGFCLVSYNLAKNAIDAFFPHIMDVWDAESYTENLLQFAGFKLNLRGEIFSFANIPVLHSGYENGTGIIRIEQQINKLRLITYAWAPMSIEHKVAFLTLYVPNANEYNLTPSNIEFSADSSPLLHFIKTEQCGAQDFYITVAFIYQKDIDAATFERLKNELSKAKPKLLLEAEQRWWMHWHRQGKLPPKIINKDYQVLLQSLTILKMAQNREDGNSFGQIVNNLSPNDFSAAFVKDMAYSIIAFSLANHHEEAKNAIKFMLSTYGGHFRSHKIANQQWGMGSEYQISLSHYAGRGYERTILKQGHPLIHLDGQGLFLWALEEYVKRSTDLGLAQNEWGKIEKLIINPLLNSIDDTGLIRRDSGFWDLPPPGLHFSYSSLAAYAGLTSASVIARALQKEELVKKYANAAAKLREKILDKLTVGKSRVISRCMEVSKFPFFLDGSTIEGINWGLMRPEWKSGESTLSAIQQYLQVGQQRGYSQAYKSQSDRGNEDIFITLRVIEALQRKGEKKQANAMLAWITDQASLNAEMLPKEFTAKAADFTGPYPVVGVGAGAYVMAVLYPFQNSK